MSLFHDWAATILRLTKTRISVDIDFTDKIRRTVAETEKLC